SEHTSISSLTVRLMKWTLLNSNYNSFPSSLLIFLSQNRGDSPFFQDEVRNLEKESVDLTSGFITILNTKTDKPKVIPIHPQLKSILQQAMEQSRSKLVFPDSKWELLNKNKFRYKMRNICDKVGIEKATPHDLRHTFASRQGLSDRVKQIIGGWSSKQVMEKTYIHTPEDYVRDEYFKVDFIPKPKKLMAS
ncbi:MAG: site-specific integrase, partial [Candidatus Omnitrophica bacterium]|nr:site-specific integrase [Candidatus Omnitrophota bacterium]